MVMAPGSNLTKVWNQTLKISTRTKLTQNNVLVAVLKSSSIMQAQVQKTK